MWENMHLKYLEYLEYLEYLKYWFWVLGFGCWVDF